MSSINRYQERIAELEAQLATERALCDRLAEALAGLKDAGSGWFNQLDALRHAEEALRAYRAAREPEEETR